MKARFYRNWTIFCSHPVSAGFFQFFFWNPSMMCFKLKLQNSANNFFSRAALSYFRIKFYNKITSFPHRDIIYRVRLPYLAHNKVRSRGFHVAHWYWLDPILNITYSGSRLQTRKIVTIVRSRSTSSLKSTDTYLNSSLAVTSFLGFQ